MDVQSAGFDGGGDPGVDSQSPPPQVGRRLRALAFPGGGLEAVAQLGAAHALLVSGSCAPDYIVGISMGAINAAAVAEVLQAGGDLDEAARLDAQVETLRRFLSSVTEVPGRLVDAITPDTFQIEARAPLRPISLPIHVDSERADRESASASKAGLIAALNLLLSVRVPLSAVTRAIRRYLAIREADEEPRWLRRNCVKAFHALGIWLNGWKHTRALAPLTVELGLALIAGRVAGGKAKGALLRLFGRSTRGMTAGDVILRWRVLRGLIGAFRFVFGLGLFGWVWGVATPIVTVFRALLPKRRRRRQPATEAETAGGRSFGEVCFDRVLAHYEIANGLANTDVLKQELVRCFDPGYYGRLDIEAALDLALARDGSPRKDPRAGARTIRDFDKGKQPIRVMPVAASVETGDLHVLEGDVRVVDALLAATALVPFFPPVPIDGRGTFVDGANVSNEPISALLVELKTGPEDPRRDLRQAASVDVYPMVPAARPEAGGNGKRFTSVLDIAARGIELERLRDADLQQRLTVLHSRTMCATAALTEIEGASFIQAEVFPVHIETEGRLGRRALDGGGKGQKLRALIREAAADGCRATLEAILPTSIRAAGGGQVACRKVIAERLPAGVPFPGADAGGGPGLSEICGQCVASRGAGDHKQQLRSRWDPAQRPDWPPRGDQHTAVTFEPPAAVTGRTQGVDPFELAPQWPVERRGTAGNQRPTINLLFGGGVFRGVFHMGVANALVELGLRPDLVAGSSVGSIIAAMIAQAFSEPTVDRRRTRIASLAATFLTLDKLVMTDRLADFVRSLTLRAAGARFSLHDLDLVLRRFDEDRYGSYEARVRRILAGIERLLYLSPHEVIDLARLARDRRLGEFLARLKEDVEELLERGGLGNEILGAEPLSLLIREHVIRRLPKTAREQALFEDFPQQGLYFLATATNMTTGRLEIMGKPRPTADTNLLYGLLASSAFPAVFRPREAWEVFHRSTEDEQYIDGGTMDNLPLDSVAEFLNAASLGGRVERRPSRDGQSVPHLVFTASLEVDPGEAAAHDLLKNCFRLAARARRLRYNGKLDAYADVQRRLRKMCDAGARPPGAWTPLDLEVVAVKPQWLCSTFGFHPMLGFRRRKQAQSIAHGCASTLVKFADVEEDRPGWVAGWGVEPAALQLKPGVREKRGPHEPGAPLLTPGAAKQEGECWFRSGARCPFSAAALRETELLGTAPETRIAELAKIYALCGLVETHRAKS